MSLTGTDHEELTVAFLGAASRVFAANESVGIFAATDEREWPGVTTRATLAKKLASAFRDIAAMDEERGHEFFARVQSHILKLAGTKRFKDGTLEDMMLLEAPGIKRAFDEIILDVCENAAHTAIIISNGHAKAANDNRLCLQP